MDAAFISDLHLDASRPQVTDAFLSFLRGDACNYSTLFILGDLFEVWIGDDCTDDHQRGVIAALKRYTDAGHKCLFVRGNRDFLIGSDFAAATGSQILPGESLAKIDGQMALVMHGDELCTDDHDYQRSRRWLRNPVMQFLYLALPRFARQKIADRIRHRSMTATRSKLPEITDVNAAAVHDAMRRHGVRLLIHGHTHRPAIHDFTLDGNPARRIVLGDWYTQGSILDWNAESEPRLRTLEF